MSTSRAERTSDYDASRQLVQRCLDVPGERLSDQVAPIDVRVSNAARIGKLYGMVSRKGNHSRGRPRRRTPHVFVPEEIAVVPRGMMEARFLIGVSIGIFEQSPASEIVHEHGDTVSSTDHGTARDATDGSRGLCHRRVAGAEWLSVCTAGGTHEPFNAAKESRIFMIWLAKISHMHRRTAYLMTIAALLLILLEVGTVAALAWQNETVDSGAYGEYSSIALSVGGEPRVSYYDRAHGDLRLARNNYDGAGWRIETVDSAGDVGQYSSLALNSAGRPCISYYDYTNSALKYAAYSGSAWTIQTVDSAGDVGLYTSLTFNGYGEPCISYYDQTNGDLKYAVHSASGWTIQTVDSAGDVGQFSSLARNYADEPCISYFDATNYRLKYAEFNGAVWQVQTVDAAGFAGMFSSLAMDIYGRPRISCYDMANADLLYAAYTGTTWQIQTADSPGAVGKYSSLRLDGSGMPRISYYDETNQDLKYAALNGSSWQVDTVDTAGTVGQYTSLVLDGAGNPQISYYNGTAGALKVAHPPLPAPTVTSIDPPNGVLGYTFAAEITGTHFHPGASVRLSRAGYPDIPGAGVVVTSPTTITCTFVIKAMEPVDYRNVIVTNADGQSGTLENGFAILRQGTGGLNWAIETVDSAGDVGWFTSMKLDKYGRPRISYVDWSNPALKYAEYNGSGWQITTVVRPGAVWEGVSLALDTAGNPRIAYQDRAAGALKYASYANASWQISVVAPDGLYGGDASLVLDPMTGNPRIAYSDYAASLLKYASYNGSAWQIQSLGIYGYECSLALDRAGRPHISFNDASGRLQYASWTGSTWNIQMLDSGAGLGTSLVLDNSDNPRIAYGGGFLKYAEYDGKAWHVSTLDSGGAGLTTSIVLDSAGHPCIAYTGPSQSSLKYAEYDGTAWHLQTIDIAANTGLDVSLALDASDNVLISYRYMQSISPATDGDLKFARGTRIVPAPGPGGPRPTVPVPTYAGPTVPVPTYAGPTVPVPTYAGPTVPVPTYAGPTVPVPTYVGPTVPVPTYVGQTVPVPTYAGPTVPIPTYVGPTVPVPTYVGPTVPIPTYAGPTVPVPTYAGPTVPIPNLERAITAVDPMEGTIGTEFTITGSGFGLIQGEVLVGPDPCDVLAWNPTWIVCKVAEPQPAGTYNVTVLVQDQPITYTGFTLGEPRISSVDIPAGPLDEGEIITVSGDFFGDTEGTVSVIDSNGTGVAAEVIEWSMQTIRFEIPGALAGTAGTYVLSVENEVGDALRFITISSGMPGDMQDHAFIGPESGCSATGIEYMGAFYVFYTHPHCVFCTDSHEVRVKQILYDGIGYEPSLVSAGIPIPDGKTDASMAPIVIEGTMWVFLTGQDGRLHFWRYNDTWSDSKWNHIGDVTTNSDWEIAPVYNPVTHRISVYYEHGDTLNRIFSDDGGFLWEEGGAVSGIGTISTAPSAVFYQSLCNGQSYDTLVAVGDGDKEGHVYALNNGTVVGTPLSFGTLYGRAFLLDTGYFNDEIHLFWRQADNSDVYWKRMAKWNADTWGPTYRYECYSDDPTDWCWKSDWAVTAAIRDPSDGYFEFQFWGYKGHWTLNIVGLPCPPYPHCAGICC